MVRELQRGPDTPTVLVVDDWRSLRERWPEVEDGIERLVRQGRGAGVHLLVAAGRWSELRTAVRDAVETRIELRLPDPLDSEIDRRLAAEVPRGRPGRGLADGAHFLAAVPSLAPTADRDPEPALADLVAQVSRAWPRPTPPRLRPLPSIVRLSDLPATGDVRLGLREGDHTVHALPPEGHLLVLGDRGSGRTALLRTLIREVVRTRPEDPVLVLDPRGALTAEAGGRVRCVRGDPAAALGDLAAHLATHLAAHLAGRPADAGRARDAAWLVADDIDLVPSAVWQPLLPLLAHGSEVGLRVVVARRTGGSARALFEPLLATLRELGSPGVLLAGSPTEGPVLGGLIPRPAPPGRARWADGDAAESRFQVAWTQP
jgi:S-DNA-T family DNA segregation ATPase FtsK/SpoIIIE